MKIEIRKSGKKVGEVYINSDAELLFLIEGQEIDVEPITEYVKGRLQEETDRYFYSEAYKLGGYLNMGEVKVDADSGDEDAKYLLSLYDAVWEAEEAAEEEVGNMNLDQLKEILPDIPGYLLPKLEAAKASLEETNE
jgi:uncharacterized protein (DUF2236 family)